MKKALVLLLVLAGCATDRESPASCSPAAVVVVDRDDVVIDESLIARGGTRSFHVRFSRGVVRDANGDGVLHVRAANVTVVCDGVLRGAEEGSSPDTFAGTGVRIENAAGVTVRGLEATGFKVGLRATRADGLVIDGARFDNLWRMRLKSTPEKEHNDDWLWPHENDKQEWATNYGAAVCIERSGGVKVSGVRVRNGQNGVILDRVERGALFDNDCSFLSGWGVAMWRSNDNLISRNALDFCVRGYSHGRYNRGQDSAGLLMFEQCCRNSVVENSLTHGGDGVFVFAGKEALGEKKVEGMDYGRRGCNDNRFAENDLSFASAHGLEVTFSFGNWISDNTLEGNAICGVWGGYSQESFIIDNRFIGNGLPGRGEGGGINIEHGCGNYIAGNRFERNTVGVSLWDDDDGALLKTPWAVANHRGSRRENLSRNGFTDNAQHVRAVRAVWMLGSANTFTPSGRCRAESSTWFGADSAIKPEAFEASLAGAPAESGVAWTKEMADDLDGTDVASVVPQVEPLGETRPVGARDRWRGREWIRMGEWGPVEPSEAGNPKR